MKALKEAQKQYWYDQGFDKSPRHWDANIELNIFAEGWKAALKWALSHSDIIEIVKQIEEELNAKA